MGCHRYQPWHLSLLLINRSMYSILQTLCPNTEGILMTVTLVMAGATLLSLSIEQESMTVRGY